MSVFNLSSLYSASKLNLKPLVALLWHKPLSSVNARWCLIQFPAASQARLLSLHNGCCRTKHMRSVCALCQTQIYGWYVNIRRQVCSHNSSPCATLTTRAHAGVIPKAKKGLATFCLEPPPPQFQARFGGNDCGQAFGQQLPPSNRWPGGKF